MAQPNFSPNTVNQHVQVGNELWIGNPGSGWTLRPAAQTATQDAKNLMEEQARKTAELNAAQKLKQDEFLTRFRTAVSGQETLPTMANRIGGELGLPALRESAQGLTKTLSSIPQVQTQATRGYDVNSNQLARIIGQKQSEIAPAAQQAVTQQQAAESNLATQLGYGVAQQQKDLLPFTTEKDLMSDQLAREFTGFTTDKQNALSLALQQIANGQALSLQELQNANAMAIAKIQYDNTKADASKYLTLSKGQTVFDPITGKAVYTAPGSLKADDDEGTPS